MKISVIHPSRGRVLKALITARNWLRNRDKMIEYILVIDEDDKENSLYHNIFDKMNIKVVEYNNTHHSCIDAINYGASIATGDVFVVISDDFDCPRHWDAQLLKELEGKEDYCVKTDDGNQPFIITLPIMDRKYYNRTGRIYFSEYGHLFADSDMSCEAWMLGRYIKINMKFPHLHYTIVGGEKDEINIKNENTHEQGRLLFDRRKSINFGIENPVPLKNQKIV